MNWEEELELARGISKMVGDHLREWRKSPPQILDVGGRDIKIRTDHEAERLDLQVLSKSSSYPVLTEESGEHSVSNTDSPVWIVDPLDGTLNYTRGLPLFCISSALWQGQQPILGVVYDVQHDELFTGVVGEGAWCNEKAIRVSDTNRADQAILATGFPVNRDFSSMALQRFIKQEQEFKKVRLLGSVALSLAYLASGRVDAYAEEDIMLWDVASMIGLVIAAGGWVSVKSSDQHKWARNVICAACDNIWY